MWSRINQRKNIMASSEEEKRYVESAERKLQEEREHYRHALEHEAEEERRKADDAQRRADENLGS